MLGKSHIARDISYAHSAQSKSGRALIKVMENMTGRIGLLRRAEGYQSDITGDKSFWDVIVERYGLELDVVSGSLSDIPTTGPLIIVSNHPYGILDGLMMGYILDHVRTDFRILAHQIFKKFEDLKRVILPISFDETKEDVQLNLETRETALDYLSQGGAIGIFPGGTVSTSAKMFSKPYDPAWRTFERCPRLDGISAASNLCLVEPATGDARIWVRIRGKAYTRPILAMTAHAVG